MATPTTWRGLLVRPRRNSALLCCDNFLYGFKGAPPARRA